MIERPIGDAIAGRCSSDLVRGVVLTDALIGTFARADDEDLQQNICFLYHLIGGGTGDWDVPIGGMGAVSGELERAARDAGATILTAAEVTAVRPGGAVDYRHDGAEDRRHRAAGSSPTWPPPCWTGSRARRLPAAPQRHAHPEPEPSPRGRPGQGEPAAEAAPAAAGRRRSARRRPSAAPSTSTRPGPSSTPPTWAAAAGAIPDPLPCEIYCHSLTDPTILSPELQAAGAQTLTVFGLHVPDRLITAENNDAAPAPNCRPPS